MRRILIGLLAFLALTATFVVLPVYAAPLPEAEPVTTSTDEVAMGSVAAPAPDADVQSGTTDPVAGVPTTAPTLTVTRTGVEPFSLVGVTWAYDPAVTDTVVQVRVSGADGTWGGWTEVTPETADQGAARTGAQLRGGTSPLWTGPSTGVDVELVTRSGAQPTDVQLDLVDPGSSPADTSLSTPDIRDTAHAAATMPPVYSRAQWGADERIRTWAPQYAATEKAATLHHTADANGYTADEVPAIMRSIYRYHTVSLGWGDIGYNVVVDRFGRLWEGRYGGLASTVMGAHAGGFNTSTFGVSMLGNFDLVPVPQATVDAVAQFIAWKFSLFGIDPRGTTVLTSGGGGTSKYAAGTKVTLPTIFGHRDVGSTVCPGRYGYARLGEIRDQVVSRMNATVSPARSRYDSDPALRSVLGEAVGAEQVTAGVSWQQYQNGRLFWTASTGVRALWGDILTRYLALGGPAALGAPVTDHLPTPRGDGYYAEFQGGSIYWSLATGPKWVKGWVLNRYTALAREQGLLGFPTSEEVAVDGGVGQTFQHGVIYSSVATGAHEVHGWVLDKWTALGRERSSLGFPTSDEIATPVGAYSTFTGGAVFVSPEAGAQEVDGWIAARWLAAGAGQAVVGHPLSGEQPAGDGVGVFTRFSNGVIYSSPQTGAYDVAGAVADKWLAMGGVSSFLGYPVAGTKPAAGGGTVSVFQGGSVYAAPATGAYEVHGWIGALWARSGGPTGPLGYPTSDEQPAPDGVGVYQAYANGLVYSSLATGAHEVHGLIEDKWTAMGGLSWGYGVPVTDEQTLPDGRGRASVFSSGAAIYFSPATGAWQVRGWIRNTWSFVNAEAGLLGYPLADEEPTGVPGASVGRFQGGNIYSSPSTGAREVHGAILARYLQLGGPTSGLGLPTSNEYSVPGGRRSDFEHGYITCNTSTGALSVTTR